MGTRENIQIEIALLVSMLLHAAVFGTWQYRGALLKAPIFSSMAKFFEAVYTPPKPLPARPQTITFVEVDEPRTQPREKETARRFMETDASQVTGEKPKDAKYYSDKSTVAANPKNPTGKESDTPYLEGKEAHVINSVDVPTPSGVPQPLVVQPGSPGAPGSTARTAPATPPQPKVPEQPKAIADTGVKMVEEVAMAPKPVVQAVTGSQVPELAGGAPTVITEPGVPGHELVARKAKLTAMGISRTGVAAFNVAESPFGAYDKKIIRAVQSRWYALIERFGMYERAGLVTVRFELLDDGQVKSLRISENTAGEILGLFCQKAILESGPFDPLPDSLRALVGKEPREASFTFYY